MARVGASRSKADALDPSERLAGFRLAFRGIVAVMVNPMEIRVVIEGNRGRRVYEAATVGRLSLTVADIVESFGPEELGGFYDFAAAQCETLDDSDSVYTEPVNPTP